MASAPLPADLEARLAMCKAKLDSAAADGQEVEAKLDDLARRFDSGELQVDETWDDDPSVVKHIAELRERVRRDSSPAIRLSAPAARRTRTPAR
jgi:hypothetical protein